MELMAGVCPVPVNLTGKVRPASESDQSQPQMQRLRGPKPADEGKVDGRKAAIAAQKR